MKLGTANRISLWVTLVTVIVTVFFGILVGAWYHRSLQNADRRMMAAPLPRQVMQNLERYNNSRKPHEPLIYTVEQFQTTFPWVAVEDTSTNPIRFGDRWLSVSLKERLVVVRDVTMQQERRHDLQIILLWTCLIAAFLSFVIAKLVVHHALRDLQKLSDAIEDISLHRLFLDYDWSHLPEKDELATIAQSVHQMTQELSRQIATMKQFVANASHELRTPLMVLRSSNELANKTGKFQETIDKNLTTITGMQSLIDGLLQLASVEWITKKSDIVLWTVVHELVEKYKELYATKSLTFVVDDEHDLVITVLEGSVEHIVGNLLDNACKYTPEGGTVWVRIEAGKLTVFDTGIGLTDEAKHAMREPFWQRDTSKHADSWYGLWLPLVKRLVEANWWTITVEDNHPTGTVFICSRT